jgi:hypothetical protein
MTTDSAFSTGGSWRAAAGVGTKDGLGSGDHDEAYTFGRRPHSAAPFPFTQRQFAHLLALRGRVRDGLLAADDRAASPEYCVVLAEALEIENRALDD